MLDRSSRRTLPLMAAALSAVAVTGCGPGGAGSTGAGPAAASSPAPAAPSATSSTEAPTGAARTIPASAFLRMPADMRRESRKADGSTAVPKLCGRELAAGDGVVASAALMSLYQGPDAPEGSVPQGMLYQTIRSYDGDGATGFLDRARDGLAACKSYRSPENTVEVRTRSLPGVADEALTVDLVQPQLDLPGDPTGGEQTNRLVVMRFGSVVTILYDSEYERSSSDPDIVDTFVRDAAKAIRTWRG